MSRWRLGPVDEAASRGLSKATGLSLLVARVLVTRGLADPAAASAFLSPSLDRLSDPLHLIDMERAVERLSRAILENDRITVYGDYDADGITATTILVRTLHRVGARADFYIPDRRAEGYGLNAEAVLHLAAHGVGLIVAVDCGVTATTAAEAARRAGIDLLILDHHEPVGDLPMAAAVVDPKRHDAAPAAADYCAAGLALQTARALLGRLGSRVRSGSRGVDGPGMDGVVELAALGTVADAVTLRGDNRIIVAEGLKRMERPRLPGLAALADVANLRPPLRARDLSFGLAPRLNAAGRLAHAGMAVNLLLTDDLDEARRLAGELDELNRQRRALCDVVLADAVDEVERDGLAHDPAIVLARDGWHPGVIGIVASQLVERYSRPALLVALHGGIGRGSARSIPALHLVEALGEVAGHLIGFGGHAMAAGVTVAADAFTRFRDDFLSAVGGRLRPEDFEPLVDIDADAGLEDMTAAVAGDVERLAPFGIGNPEPVFQTRGLRAIGTRLVGDGSHLRLVVTDGARTVEAIAFRQADRAELLAFTQARFDLAYTVERDRWRDGNGVQLVVEDLHTPDVDVEAITADVGPVLDRLFARAEDYLDLRLDAVEQAVSFNTKVVGVTFEGRQALLPSVRPGERLRLVRDPHNPRDPHAIRVCTADGRQLGFLRATLAARLAPSMDAGARYSAAATAVTGGGDRAWGLNLYVQREAPWSREADSEELGHPVGGTPGARLAFMLGRGRPMTAPQREVVEGMRTGGRLAVRIGPGRGLLPTVLLAAAALAPSARPVMVIFPRASDVEAWYALAAPPLREIGLRAVPAHGAFSAFEAWRLAGARERGEVDVVLASLAWAERHPDAAAATVVVLDAVGGSGDLASLDGLAGTLRMFAGPLTQAMIDEIRQRWPAFAEVSSAAPVRENLRIVDRRGRQSLDALSVDRTRREKTLVVASDAAHSVAVARHLREQHADRAESIAYYHAGLPVPLRRVLEDLFAAGRIATLVAGTLLVDPAVPEDLTHVVAVGVRGSQWLTAESLAVAGLRGRAASVELAYDPDTLAAAQTLMEARFPRRDALVRCYRSLRDAARDRPWSLAGDVAEPLLGSALPGSGLPQAALVACLDILVEAGVVVREDPHNGPSQYTLAETSGRIDLTRSLRYVEGERERAAWVDLRAWAMGPVGAILGDLARA